MSVVLFSADMDTFTDNISTIERQMYSPACDVFTGLRVYVSDLIESVATILLLGAIHWSMGVTVRNGTTDTKHSRLNPSPASTTVSIVVDTIGEIRSGKRKKVLAN